MFTIPEITLTIKLNAYFNEFSLDTQCNFRDSEYLGKLDKEYLNTLLCKFYIFF